MLSKLKTLAALCGAFFIALGIAWLRGRSAGIQHMEQEQAKRRLESVKQRKEIDDEVQNLGSNDFDQSLNRWMRDDR